MREHPPPSPTRVDTEVTYYVLSEGTPTTLIKPVFIQKSRIMHWVREHPPPPPTCVDTKVSYHGVWVAPWSLGEGTHDENVTRLQRTLIHRFGMSSQCR